MRSGTDVTRARFIPTIAHTFYPSLFLCACVSQVHSFCLSLSLCFLPLFQCLVFSPSMSLAFSVLFLHPWLCD